MKTFKDFLEEAMGEGYRFSYRGGIIILDGEHRIAKYHTGWVVREIKLVNINPYHNVTKVEVRGADEVELTLDDGTERGKQYILGAYRPLVGDPKSLENFVH